MHDIYCLQLERFLCRDCGKIKCSCDVQPTVLQSESVSKTGENNSIAHDNDSGIDNTIEYRNPKLFIRQSSGPEIITPKSHSLNKRSSEEPFVRSAHGENGKLRRSFAVRSREGLENLLSFASIRNGQSRGKAKQTIAR